MVTEICSRIEDVSHVTTSEELSAFESSEHADTVGYLMKRLPSFASHSALMKAGSQKAGSQTSIASGLFARRMPARTRSTQSKHGSSSKVEGIVETGARTAQATHFMLYLNR